MATYSVKLVNHTNATARLQQSIKTNLQNLFNQVFSGTSDKTVVDWGTGSASNSIVLHFVDDIASSYLQQQMPGQDIRGDAGYTLVLGGMSRAQSSTCILCWSDP